MRQCHLLDLSALVLSSRRKGELEGCQPSALLSWAPLPFARTIDYVELVVAVCGLKERSE